MASTTQTIWTKAFWAGAGERAFSTFWQTWLATFGLGTGVTIATIGSGYDFLAMPWIPATLTALMATFLSLVKSLVQPDFTSGVTSPPVLGSVPIGANAVTSAPTPAEPVSAESVAANTVSAESVAANTATTIDIIQAAQAAQSTPTTPTAA